MSFDQQLEDFVTAWNAGDQQALSAILKTVDDEDTDQFLERVAQRTGEHNTPQVNTAAVTSSLESAGLGTDDAELLSILSTGNFADWVKARLAVLGAGADTITEQIHLANDSLDDVEMDLAASWLEQVVADGVSDVELTDEAVAAISKALDASPRTITSMVERDRA